MDKLKLKSYALLMAYDLPKLCNRSSESLKNAAEVESDPKRKQFLIEIASLKVNHIDIYSWKPDWKELCNFLDSIYKGQIRIEFLDSELMLLMLKSKNIESEYIDLETLSRRFCFLINKVCHSKSLFYAIHDNYMDFRKHHKDIEFGSEKFNEIILKKFNKGRTKLSAERTNRDVKEYFESSKKNKTPTFDFVINNLPFDFLTEIKTSNDNKISLYFQKMIAREMLFYLNLTKMTITQKYYFLGFSFLLCGFVYNEEEFKKRKLLKDKYYEFAQSDYEEYLMFEGYNVYKVL
jgi:hypothetical protein